MASIDIPTNCLICDNFITPGQSVLLHCECVFAICQSCVYAQIAVQHYTYLRGLTCPSCRVASYNITGIEKCQLEEKRLVQSAAKFFSRSKSKAEPSDKQLLIRAIQAGHESSILLEDLKTDGVNLGVPLEASMIRLELARVESRRLARLGPFCEEKDVDGSLGPLAHLRISKNIFLEAAIELTLKLKGLNAPSNDIANGTKQSSLYSISKHVTNVGSTSVIEDENPCAEKSKQLCVCGDEEGGFYVQCTNGTGGCNGWVHPECIPRLRGLSKESIGMLQDFVCPLCELKVQNMKLIVEGSRVHVTSGKFRGCDAIVLSKTIGTHIRVRLTNETPYPDHVVSLHIKQLDVREPSECSPTQKIISRTSNVAGDPVLPDNYPIVVPQSSAPPRESTPRSLESSCLQSYCICGNRGTGKFVECRSEGKCRSSRFFHMSCVGFVDSPNPAKQKSFVCQECDKFFLDSKRFLSNSEISTVHQSSMTTDGSINRYLPTDRLRSPLYLMLFENRRNQYFNNPPRMPYYHSSRHETSAPRTSTTVKPQSHAPPLFLPPGQFPLPRPPAYR